VLTPSERQQKFAAQREARRLAAQAAAKRELDLAPVREIAMTELHLNPAGVVGRVRTGEIAVVSKHRRAVAMIIPITDESQLAARDPAGAADLPALADEFAARALARQRSALRHGRWYGKRYKRYRRYRRRGRPRG
jgi:antitoxin (DNA-binding transcriptional repressor) of toxin-antitoxin stability system